MGALRVALVWSAIYGLVAGLGLKVLGTKSAILASLVVMLGILSSMLITWLLQPVIVGGWTHNEEMRVRFRDVGSFLRNLYQSSRRINRTITWAIVKKHWSFLLLTTLMIGVIGGLRYQLPGALVGGILGGGFTLYLMLLTEAHKISSRI